MPEQVPTRPGSSIPSRAKLAAAPPWLYYLLPKISDSIWIGVFLFVLAMGRSMMNLDGDLGRHITIGSYILSAGNIPTSDLFSHTMVGQPLTPHEWLSQVIFAGFYQAAGFPGAALVSALLISTTFWLVYLRSRLESGSVFAAVSITLLAVFASLLHWVSRPHLFTFLFLSLWMHQLEAMHANKPRWWVFPVMMLLWANLHGAFIAGLVTWGLYTAGVLVDALRNRTVRTFKDLNQPTLRAFFLAGATSLMATMINPSGIRLWDTSVGYLGERFLVDMTVEYRSPDFHQLSVLPFLVMIGLTLVLFGLARRKVSAAHVFLLSAWMLMGLYSARNIPLFAIVSAPAIAALAADWLKGGTGFFSFLARFQNFDERLAKMELDLRGILYPLLVVLWTAVSLFPGAGLGANKPEITHDPAIWPVAAVDWLEEHPQQGNLFNQFDWGGYLLFRLWPDQRVFIDGQTDFYGPDLTREYLDVMDLKPGWEDTLRKYQVEWAILPTNAGLSQELFQHPGWQEVYTDPTASVFIRKR